MEEKFQFTPEEAQQTRKLLMELRGPMADFMRPGDLHELRTRLDDAARRGLLHRDAFGLNPIVHALQTARIAVEETGLKRDGVTAIMLYEAVAAGACTASEVGNRFGPSVANIIKGIAKIEELYRKSPVIESDNFRNLLVSFAEDMRVILIMIADRVNVMRQIRDTKALDARRRVAEEASYLYAPLAHKLGLYRLKSELEDLSLKYLQHDAYYMIKDKLNATKAARDAYIDSFIQPVKNRLEEAGLKFHIKGRTKSIHSIYQKMKHLGFTNFIEEHVKLIYVPCYLNGNDGIFNMSYYDLIPGFDLTVFASYYEPWGYTPLESIAFGVPTITTDLAGFGQWIKDNFENEKCGVKVIHRTDSNYSKLVHEISDTIEQFSAMPDESAKILRKAAQRTAKQASWDNFIKFYQDVYSIALTNAQNRNK